MTQLNGPVPNRLSVVEQDDLLLIRLAGELDLISASAVIQVLPRPQDCRRRIVLDISQVTVCAAAGLRILLMFCDRIQTCGGELHVRRPSDAVMRVLDALGEADRLPLESASEQQPTPHGSQSTHVRQALNAALRATGAPMGYARAPEPGSGTLHVVAHRGVSGLLPSFFEAMHCDEPAQPTRADQLPARYVEDVLALSGQRPFVRNALRLAGVRAFAAVPLAARSGVLLGQLCILRHTVTRWSQDQRQALKRIADHHAAPDL